MDDPDKKRIRELKLKKVYRWYPWLEKYRFFMLDWLLLCIFVIDHDPDDIELSVVRYKPDGIEALARTTKFSKKELQLMYRGFKAVSTLLPRLYHPSLSQGPETDPRV
ncbi:uncharacterized protein [Panulirus ornatus]|uniref:uncharacterized protein n=1 Tax=Panulirus ornatus TaxID=150431 RepID=UPI003A87B5EB